MLAALPACTPPLWWDYRRLAQEVRHQIRLGDLNRALALAERGWSRWRAQPRSEMHWEFRLLRAQVLVHQGKPQPVLELLTEEPPAGERFMPARARRLMCLGRARFLEADYPASRVLMDQALGLARRVGDALLLSEVQLWRGSTLARCGEFQAADEAYQEGLRLAAQRGDVYLQAAALGNRGFVRINSTRYDEAIPYFQEALRLAEKAGFRRFAANATGNLGRCYAGLGEHAQAVRLLSQAARLMGESGDFNGQQIWLGNLGEAYHAQGNFRSAIGCYRNALEIARRLGASYFTLMWTNKLTELSLEAGDLKSAEDYNRQARQISPNVTTRGAGIWSALWQARILAAQGRVSEAERRYREVLASASPAEERSVIWTAHAGLADLYAATGQSSEADAEFRQALAVLEETRSRLSRDEWKLSFHAASIRLYQDYVDFLVSSRRAERALEVAESCRARVLVQKLGLTGGGSWSPAAWKFREAARRLGATLMSFWLAPRRSFLWVVQPDRVVCFRLPSNSEIEPLVAVLRGAIEGLRDPLASELAAARRLHAMLIEPAASLLRPQARLIVVPDGPLHEVNLESLVAAKGAPRYWIEDVTLALVPSLALLVGSRQEPPARRDSLLLIGDPTPTSEFPRLPEAQKEIAAVGRRLPASRQLVLTGADAHPDCYRLAGPQRFSLIHFAAHATASADNPLDSAIILSPRENGFKLYARQVMGIPLRAELVTMSACRGAGARSYSGEGLVGFAWAFLQAGSRNVIAGLWDVPDSSTAVLMERLYAELAAGRGPAQALRAAKRALLESRSAWSKPFYWAPFQLYSRVQPF